MQVAAREQPSLLITVDNGISSIEGVAAARDLGIRVVVTDHHLAGEVLPEADAIVNPNQPDDAFPSKALAGVGVMFYLLGAVRARLRESGWFGPRRREPQLAQFLDLVALGTVADLVPLDHNNRILVAQGLDLPSLIVSTGLYARSVPSADDAWAALDDQAEVIDGPVIHWHKPSRSSSRSRPRSRPNGT